MFHTTTTPNTTTLHNKCGMSDFLFINFEIMEGFLCLMYLNDHFDLRDM